LPRKGERDNMATTVNEEKEIVLVDGTKINIRPLKISLLKPFMKKFEGIAEVASDNEKSMSILMECVQIAMKQYKPELAEDLAALEELLDLPLVYKIVEEASGVRLTDSLINV
jgi:inhibitor of KinA sporulation pathway (predicted exonuclease)